VIYRTERLLSKPQSTGGQNDFFYFSLVEMGVVGHSSKSKLSLS